jgi:hypothetical protein
MLHDLEADAFAAGFCFWVMPTLLYFSQLSAMWDVSMPRHHSS